MIPYNSVYKNFDPDSSLYTWENLFTKLYTKDAWDFWQIFDFENLIAMGSKNVTRMVAKNVYSVDYPQFNRYLGEFKISGDTDFNFKSGCIRKQKYEYYFTLINNEFSFTDNEKSYYLEQLKHCNKMHHSLENFSLMPVTGCLNIVKGCLPQDRFDSFIYWLNDYFEKKDTIGFEHLLFSKAIAINRNKKLQEENTLKLKTILFQYLNLFNDIYDYCLKIYKINDKDFVKSLVKSGINPIENGRDVVNYMNLAEQYWALKRELILSR